MNTEMNTAIGEALQRLRTQEPTHRGTPGGHGQRVVVEGARVSERIRPPGIQQFHEIASTTEAAKRKPTAKRKGRKKKTSGWIAWWAPSGSCRLSPLARLLFARDEQGKLHPLDVAVGDRILFGKWSGTEVKLDGEDLLIMKESDILGVLDATAKKSKAA